MLSKLLPWDFVTKYPKTIQPNEFGIHAFYIDDPFLERILLDRLPKKENTFSLYSGNEFGRDFIEEHFLNLSFFSQNESHIIMNAETISSTAMDFFLESGVCLDDRHLLFFFSKASKHFSELCKSQKIKVMGIELLSPRFWEGQKIWQFAQNMKQVRLEASVSRFALEHLEHNLESFLWLIDTIGLHFQNRPVDLGVLGELVKKERWDFFELIDIFNRSPKNFFNEILKKDMDYEWMRALSAFMQTHIVKVLFPEEIMAKEKLSKYDQGIIDLSEKVSRGTLKYYLQFFSELEIMSKSSDPFLVDKIRLEVLK